MSKKAIKLISLLLSVIMLLGMQREPQTAQSRRSAIRRETVTD